MSPASSDARGTAVALDGNGLGRDAVLARGRQRADLDHVVDRREARVAHGLEMLDLVGEDAGQLAVEVERAAAHAGDGTHELHARVGEFAKNQTFARAEGVAQNTCHLDAKRFRRAAFENGPDLALHARLQLVDRNQRRIGRLSHERQWKRDYTEEAKGEAEDDQELEGD